MGHCSFSNICFAIVFYFIGKKGKSGAFKLKTNLKQKGKVFVQLNMMIAAHALAIKANLVTNVYAFSLISVLHLVD
jgi:predicted nucleic acid-binding protein